MHSKKRLLASLCPSVCPHVSARLPLQGIFVKFDTGVCMKICRETPNFVKIEQKHRNCTRRRKGVLLLQAKLNRLKITFAQHWIFSYCLQWYVSQQYAQNALLRSHWNNGYAKAPQCYLLPTLPILSYLTVA